MNKTKQSKAVKESRLVLFGNAHDPDLQDSINRAGITGRKVEMQARPAFDTGLGKCGKHLCSCKHVCVNSSPRLMDANTVAERLRNLKAKLKNKQFYSAAQLRIFRKAHARLNKQWKHFTDPTLKSDQLHFKY